MIRGLSRCLQYRNGLSERFVRSHWSTPSSSETVAKPKEIAKPREKTTEESRDSDFAASFKNLLPSPQLRSLLSDGQKKNLEHLIKQVELYCYMARKVPSYITDENWQELLALPSVIQRVSRLEFYAVKQRREENDRTKEKEDEYSAYMEKQRESYNAGGMGYGPDMYEIISNPMRRKSRLHQIDGSRVWSSLRLRDAAPTIVMDMQYIFDGKHKGEFNIKRQLQYVISQNMHATRPLPLVFSNVADNAFGKEYMENWLGYWGGSYTDQTILPDFSYDGTRDALIKSTGNKNPKIVYISRYAKKILDGPLNADAYVLCASYDLRRESIIAAHRDKIEAYRLPIQRYVKWAAGPQIIAFPNTMRLFRDLVDSGGDWRTAFHNNIAKRNLELPPPEVIAIRQNQRNTMKRDKEDIINAIVDSYGERPHS